MAVKIPSVTGQTVEFAKKAIKENKSDKLSLAKALLENIQSTDVDVCNAVKNSLFVIINNPSKYNPERDRFVKTLKKYII
jgi:sialic acid synthase SpsE